MTEWKKYYSIIELARGDEKGKRLDDFFESFFFSLYFNLTLSVGLFFANDRYTTGPLRAHIRV